MAIHTELNGRKVTFTTYTFVHVNGSVAIIHNTTGYICARAEAKARFREQGLDSRDDLIVTH